MWGLIPALVLGGLGAYVYTERRRQGRIEAGVQSGLWLLGVALLLVIRFFFPGILILAGASLLMRGREHVVNRKVEEFLDKMGIKLPSPYNGQNPITHAPSASSVQHTPAQQAPHTPDQEQAQTASKPSTGETTRL
jgi:hypothetical protein